MAASFKGRALAIVAGCAFAAGGLTILLDKDLTKPLDWASSQWLTILTVFGTIAAGHLMVDAARARHVFATLGFLTLFLAGTGLVVYNSVGRQVETAGVTTLSVEDANARLADLKTERQKAVARRDYADQQAAFEIAGRPDKRGRPTTKAYCGKSCKDWQQNSRDVTAAIENLDREIAKIGPAKPVNAQAEAMADIAALFGFSNKARTVAALTLVLPFLKTLFFEIGSIVSLGFAFRSSTTAIPAKPDVPEIPENRNSGNSGPSKPPKSGRRGRKANPNVINFAEKFQQRNGRAPTAGELKSAFPGMATSTAYEYAARCRGSSRIAA
jgi:uncharacterized membrane protein